jgi:hypothetical protein
MDDGPWTIINGPWSIVCIPFQCNRIFIPPIIQGIARIHAHILESGGERKGKHHEIYLKDPRRTAPERLQTVLRLPFGK